LHNKKIYYIFVLLKKQIMKFVLQHIANFILKKMEKCPKDQVEFWFNMGMQLEITAMSFGVELE